MNPGEQILSDLVVALKNLSPDLQVETTKNKLATVLSEYYIQRVELGEVHPDLEDKIQLFISAKRLEGVPTAFCKNPTLSIPV
jgi:integrase/recombinase XerD